MHGAIKLAALSVMLSLSKHPLVEESIIGIAN